MASQALANLRLRCCALLLSAPLTLPGCDASEFDSETFEDTGSYTEEMPDEAYRAAPVVMTAAAKIVLKSIVSEGFSLGIGALLGESRTPVDLSEASFERIRSIVHEEITVAWQNDVRSEASGRMEQALGYVRSLDTAGRSRAGDLLWGLGQTRNRVVQFFGIQGVQFYQEVASYYLAASAEMVAWGEACLAAKNDPHDSRCGPEIDFDESQLADYKDNFVAHAQLVVSEMANYERLYHEAMAERAGLTWASLGDIAGATTNFHYPTTNGSTYLNGPVDWGNRHHAIADGYWSEVERRRNETIAQLINDNRDAVLGPEFAENMRTIAEKADLFGANGNTKVARAPYNILPNDVALSSADALIWANRLHSFTKGSGDHLQHVWEAPDGTGGNEKLGNIRLNSAPVTLAWMPEPWNLQNDELHTFARSENNRLLQIRYTPNGWGEYELGTPGIIASPPTAIVWDNNSLHTFSSGSNGQLIQIRYNGQWGEFQLGGNVQGKPSAIKINGMLQVFVKGANGNLKLFRYNGGWQQFDIGYAITSAPEAIVQDGYIYVYARGSNGNVIEMSVKPGQAWKRTDLGIATSTPVRPVLVGDERQLYFRSAGGTLANLTLRDGAWTSFDTGMDMAGNPPGVVSKDGVAQVIFRGANDEFLRWN